MKKIYDCVTFFQENLQMELRFAILDEVIDKFVVCESVYDHRGNSKKINFSKKNFPKYENKIEHIVITKKFPEKNSPWENQAWQREFIFDGIKDASNEDYIMFSDPDEIPNPKSIKNLNLRKKFGIFFQKMFTYKLNLFNKYESPWEGTRVCKKKNLKSIDFMRQKIKTKNLKYNFLRFDKEKNIEIFYNAGWHFNNIMSAKEISLKLKTFAHSEFSDEKFSSEEIIRKKIANKEDLFERGHKYEKVKIDESYPDFLIKNIKYYKDYILEQ